MKFSIVTCTWNSEPWLEDSLASVACQDYPSIERIFVDGGSTDGTLERIARVPGEVKVLHGVRGGISKAMNEGVQAATGDVVAHLHSDDMYSGPRVLSTVAERLQASNALWLFGRCRSLIDGRLLDNDYVMPTYSWPALLRGNMIPHPATFVRRTAFLEAGGFDLSWKYAMDYDLWLKIGRLGPPVQLPDYLAAFRYHAGSLSTRNAWAAHQETFKVRLKHAGPNPLGLAEHALRHGVRSWRMLRQPQVHSAGSA